MDGFASLGEQYHKQPALVRLAEEHEALLAFRMAQVVGQAAKWITEHRRGFLKRDLVLRTIDRCLRSVPLEAQGPRQLSVLMGGGMRITGTLSGRGERMRAKRSARAC